MMNWRPKDNRKQQPHQVSLDQNSLTHMTNLTNAIGQLIIRMELFMSALDDAISQLSGDVASAVAAMSTLEQELADALAQAASAGATPAQLQAINDLHTSLQAAVAAATPAPPAAP